MNTSDQYFETHYQRLVTLARRVVGDAATAEEVAADALERLTNDPVIERNGDDVAAWLNRVTINAALNQVRSQRRYHARVLAVAAQAPATVDEDPADVIVARDEAARVRHTLAELPERQATAMLLRHAGHSYEEIAATLGVAVGSVGVLLARGERAFRTAWETS